MHGIGVVLLYGGEGHVTVAAVHGVGTADGIVVGLVSDVIARGDAEAGSERQREALAVVAGVVIDEAVGHVGGVGGDAADAAAEGHLAGAADVGAGAAFADGFVNVAFVEVEVLEGAAAIVADDGAPVRLGGSSEVVGDHTVPDSGIFGFADDGAKSYSSIITVCVDPRFDNANVLHSAILDIAEQSDIGITSYRIHAQDEMIAAVVGACEIVTVIFADRRMVGRIVSVASAEIDIAGLAEGLAVGDARAATIDDRSEIAQFGLVGDGVGGGASLGGHGEEIAAELGAALGGKAAPVARGVRLLGGGAGEDDVLQGFVVLEDLSSEADGTVVLDVDALQVHTVVESALVQAGHAGGQRDGGQGVAVVEGFLADGGDTRANGERRQLLTAGEGVGADGGDAVLDGDAGEVVTPGGVGVPGAGFVVAVVLHRPAAADGQLGVVVVAVLGKAPGQTVVGGAAGIAVGHLKAIERGVAGEGDGILPAGP